MKTADHFARSERKSLRERFRYRRRPTAETIAAMVIFLAGLIIATIFFTSGEDAPISSEDTPGRWTVQVSGVTVTLHDVIFVDSMNGWAVGGGGVILHTTDGGDTWEEQNSGTDFDLASVDFVNSNDGWAVGKFGTILHTSDGGDTWEAQGTNSITLARNLIAVTFADEQYGWVSTDRGSFLLATSDGGKTWRREFFGNTSNRSDIFFLDAQRGWVVQSGGGVLHTSDGGVNWELEPGITEVRVGTNSLFFLDESHGWIAGWRSKGSEVEFTRFLSDGMVARTLDGGRSWTRHDSGTGRFLWDVEFLNSHEGWAVGSQETILYSNDGGVTWRTQNSGSDRVLRAVSFPDDNNGWAVGDGGTVLKYAR